MTKRRRFLAGAAALLSAPLRAATIHPPHRALARPIYDAEVEWLGSDGPQYIDTGVKGSLVCAVDARYLITAWSSYAAAFNCYVNEASNAVRVIMAGANTGYGWCSVNTRANGSLRIPCAENTWYDYSASVDSGKVKAIVNGVEFSQNRVNGTANGNNVRLLGSPGARIATFKLYGAGDVPLIDLQAVRLFGVGYMYDRLSGRLFGVAGTGSLAVGPDKQ